MNTYIDYIQTIKNSSDGSLLYDYRGREVYTCNLSDGILRVKLSKADGEYLNLALVQFQNKTCHMIPCCFDLSDLQRVCDEYFNSEIVYERVSHRRYGQSKLSKPSELRGIRQSFSVDFIPNKCKCPCFCLNDDLYIYHRDFFSSVWKPPDNNMGKSTDYYLRKYFNKNKTQKFIYSDSWGDIEFRNEAWIVFKNLKPYISKHNYNQLANILLEIFISNDTIANKNLSEYISMQAEWERFFETIIKVYIDYWKDK